MPDRPPATLRLQAYLAQAGIASRRASELLIRAGRVRVNSVVVTELGTKVGPADTVEFDGKTISVKERLRYILLNKPAGYICALSDPEGRPLAIDLLRPAVIERVYNVGRLDQWSAGLLLFTNDGALASRIVHPSGGFDKEYEIQADAPLPDAFFEEFSRGLVIDGVDYRALDLHRTGVQSARLILIEGKNREIRRVLEHFGRRALVLRRIRLGPLLIGDLREGSFRDLTDDEVRSLNHYGSASSGGPSRPSPRSPFRSKH
ncbi:MAG TPA: pseudouridine synthase [Rectinemataceae bacterium]|nr:pseudouridine synthase [Rectinemataceae bacterium]